MKYLVLILLLAPSITFSFDTGNNLQEICREGKGISSELICHSYINGVIEGIILGARVASLDITGEYVDYKIFCLTDDVTIDQYVTVVKKYMEDHLDDLNEQSPALISLAIKEKFPCE
jgi:hypothetical protein